MTQSVDTYAPSHAASALSEHLLRIDHQLAQAGTPRDERDATLRQIAEQFYDQLPQPIEDVSREQVDAALASIGSELAYRGDELTVGQLLRMLAARLGGSTSVPLALNDGGRKRVVWGEVVKRLAYMGLVFIGLMLMMSAFTRQPLKGPSLLLPGLIFAGTVLGVLMRVRNMPVHTLPRAEDWPDDLTRRHRWAWVVMFTCVGLVTLTLLVVAYMVVVIAMGRPVWPLDQAAQNVAGVGFGVLGIGLWVLSVQFKRRRRQHVERWTVLRSP